MTLDGTNTWVLRAPDAPGAVVVDPGPDDEAHLSAVVAAAQRVTAILLTHGHADHSAGARRLHDLTAEPVRRVQGPHRR
ncbi:MAG: MBL fold metallo-hydrolase, partial [Jatrophihabitans sp.]